MLPDLKIDVGKIRAVFYGNDWHSVAPGSARIERVWMMDPARAAGINMGEWLVFAGRAGTFTTRIKLYEITAFSTNERGAGDE